MSKFYFFGQKRYEIPQQFNKQQNIEIIKWPETAILGCDTFLIRIFHDFRSSRSKMDSEGRKVIVVDNGSGVSVSYPLCFF